MNTVRTILLIGLLTALMVAVGGVIGGKQGLYIAFFIAVVTNIGSYWFSDKIALKMAGAQPIDRDQAPELYEIVEGLAKRDGIPTPPIYIIETDAANAFATGRDPNHAAVAVTSGILNIMDRGELEAVLAHELSHVRNRDVLIASMAAVMAATVTMIAHYGMFFGARDDREGGSNPIFALLLIILAPIAATLINLAVSRSREYEADASGARLCGHPEALASALAKLENISSQIPMQGVNPALSSLYIVKPDPKSFFVNLFSTHPPTEKRIERLEAMERQ